MIKTEEDIDRYIKENNISNFYVYLTYINYGNILSLAQYSLQEAYLLTNNRPYKVSGAIKEMSKVVLDAIKNVTAISLNISETDSFYTENLQLKLHEEDGHMWISSNILPDWAAYILKKGDKLQDDEVPDVSEEEKGRLCNVLKPPIEKFKEEMGKVRERYISDSIDKLKIKNKGYAGLYEETQRLSKAHNKFKTLYSEPVKKVDKKFTSIFNKIV